MLFLANAFSYAMLQFLLLLLLPLLSLFCSFSQTQLVLADDFVVITFCCSVCTSQFSIREVYPTAVFGWCKPRKMTRQIDRQAKSR